jgi:folate-binding protein YgfZ
MGDGVGREFAYLSGMSTDGYVTELADRAVLSVTGPDAQAFLQGLVTADMDDVAASGRGYGALLTPQGKIIADFFVIAVDDGFLIDTPRPLAADLMRRLTLYKLRAKLTLADETDKLAVLALWGTETLPPMPGRTVSDPRLPALGWRSYVQRGVVGPAESPLESVPREAFEAHRTRLAIPEGGGDFAYGDAFPHEVAMDALAGVDFAKGCYVGQEVVSRMQHRGTARNRPAVVSGTGPLPDTGTVVTAGGKPAGTLGSVAGTTGLAILRLDRIADAVKAGAPVLAGDTPVTISLPAWAPYGWPGADRAD